MNALIVSANGIPVGTIEIENGRWKFSYAAEWKDYALSPNFPIATRKFEDTADAKPVEWFFENLLPEGRLRDLIAFRDRIDPRDTWALLIRHGQDTAGALSLIPKGLMWRLRRFWSHSRESHYRKRLRHPERAISL